MAKRMGLTKRGRALIVGSQKIPIAIFGAMNAYKAVLAASVVTVRATILYRSRTITDFTSVAQKN